MIKTLLDNLFLLNESLLNLLHSCLHSLCYNFFLESKTYFSTKSSGCDTFIYSYSNVWNISRWTTGL